MPADPTPPERGEVERVAAALYAAAHPKREGDLGVKAPEVQERWRNAARWHLAQPRRGEAGGALCERGARSVEDVQKMLCEASCVDVSPEKCAGIWALMEHPATTLTTLAVIAWELGEAHRTLLEAAAAYINAKGAPERTRTGEALGRMVMERSGRQRAPAAESPRAGAVAWSKEAPTVPGWYWMRERGGEPEAVKVGLYSGRMALFVHGPNEGVSCEAMRAEWSPLSAPLAESGR